MTSTSDSTPAQAALRPPGAPGLPRSLVAHPAYGPLPGLLLILTVVTGVVDSISILALGRVFVANMTGNVVFAGFAIVGAPGFSLSASLFALAARPRGAHRYSGPRSRSPRRCASCCYQRDEIRDEIVVSTSRRFLLLSA
jgi:Protein of unknown function (DUF1275)